MQIVNSGDLRRGDVLLFHGNGLLSRFIRLFDGSQYSHAGIFDGEHVIEAEAVAGDDAVQVHDLATSCNSAAFTHVYRYMNDERQKLNVDLPYDPVEVLIDAFRKAPEAYAYSQILLLGVLLATRRIPVPGITEILRHVLDEAAEWLNSRLDGGRKVIICSELVYKCFNDVGDDRYRLDVAMIEPSAISSGLQSRATLMPSMTSHDSDQHFQKDIGAFMATYRLARGIPQIQFATADDTAAIPRAVPEFVTPRDLATSPNLVLVGQLVP